MWKKGAKRLELPQGHRMSQLERNPRTRPAPLQRRLPACLREGTVCPHQCLLCLLRVFFQGAQHALRHYLISSLSTTVIEAGWRSVCFLPSSRQTECPQGILSSSLDSKCKCSSQADKWPKSNVLFGSRVRTEGSCGRWWVKTGPACRDPNSDSSSMTEFNLGK